MRPPSMPTALPLTVNSRKVPILGVEQATDRLAEGWLPFVFFTNHHSGRGNLLYRRYDGNLGLVSPIDDCSARPVPESGGGLAGSTR